MSVEVSVWDQTGATKLAVLQNAVQVRWQDQKNSAGAGQVSLDASDPKVANLAYGNLLKFGYAGVDRFAARIETVTRAWAADKGLQTVTATAAGGVSLLNSAAVYPELGLSSSARSQRWFGWQSVTFDDSAWSAPQGERQDDPGKVRSGYPTGWPDGAAQWITMATPDSTEPDWRVTLFRKAFTLSTSGKFRIWVTGDDKFSLFLDGELLGQTTLTESQSWADTISYDVSMAGGEHLLAARVLNGPLPGPGDPNPSGLLLSMASLNPDGSPATTVLRSDTSWLAFVVSGQEPGFTAVQIARILYDEAVARGCFLQHLTPSFSATLDTAGKAPAGIVSRAFDIGSSVLDACTAMAETSFDFAVGPDLSLNVWDGDRGADLSATVVFLVAASLLRYQTNRQGPVANHALIRSLIAWQETSAATSESSYGRWETGLEVGNTTSDAQALLVGSAMLGKTAQPLDTVTMQHTDTIGPRPYVDYNVCDKVTALGVDGAAATAQVVSITVEVDGDGNVAVTPELELA